MAETSSWMETFTGQRIAVLTQSGNEEKSDTGTLTRMTGGWLQMVKDNGEMILIPSSAIRIIKLLDLTQSLPAIDPTAHLSTRIYEPNAQTL